MTRVVGCAQTTPWEWKCVHKSRCVSSAHGDDGSEEGGAGAGPAGCTSQCTGSQEEGDAESSCSDLCPLHAAPETVLPHLGWFSYLSELIKWIPHWHTLRPFLCGSSPIKFTINISNTFLQQNNQMPPQRYVHRSRKAHREFGTLCFGDSKAWKVSIFRFLRLFLFGNVQVGTWRQDINPQYTGTGHLFLTWLSHLQLPLGTAALAVTNTPRQSHNWNKHFNPYIPNEVTQDINTHNTE